MLANALSCWTNAIRRLVICHAITRSKHSHPEEIELPNFLMKGLQQNLRVKTLTEWASALREAIGVDEIQWRRGRMVLALVYRISGFKRLL